MKNFHVLFIVRGIEEGGVKVVLTGLLNELHANAANLKKTGVKITILTDSPEFRDLYPSFEVKILTGSSKLWWDWIASFFYLRSVKPQVVVYTKNVIPLTHLLSGWKKAVIVYDLAFYIRELKAYKFFDTWYMRTLLPLSVRFADTVFAISRATAADIRIYTGRSLDQICILPLAARQEFSHRKSAGWERLSEKLSISSEDPFLLYIGSLSPRKNILRTLQAFEQVSNQIPHKLYLVIGKQWGEEAVHVREYVKKYLSERVSFLPFLPTEELAHLNRKADALLYASLYEGFGLPIIESQTCGCPVITSTTTSCPEVGGDGALYVDPMNVEEIARAIKTVTTNGPLTQQLIALGVKNATKYSWSRTANIFTEKMYEFHS